MQRKKLAIGAIGVALAFVLIVWSLPLWALNQVQLKEIKGQAELLKDRPLSFFLESQPNTPLERIDVYQGKSNSLELDSFMNVVDQGSIDKEAIYRQFPLPNRPNLEGFTPYFNNQLWIRNTGPRQLAIVKLNLAEKTYHETSYSLKNTQFPYISQAVHTNQADYLIYSADGGLCVLTLDAKTGAVKDERFVEGIDPSYYAMSTIRSTSDFILEQDLDQSASSMIDPEEAVNFQVYRLNPETLKVSKTPLKITDRQSQYYFYQDQVFKVLFSEGQVKVSQMSFNSTKEKALFEDMTILDLQLEEDYLYLITKDQKIKVYDLASMEELASAELSTGKGYQIVGLSVS